MDLSELLISEYRGLYKMKKSFGDVLNAARKTRNDHRRISRNAEIFSKRRINEETMSPYITPNRKKTPKKKIEKVFDQTKLDEKSKRFEKLLAWKQDKEKKKQEQRQKAKPIFKVTHVPVAIGLTNLENVNKQIKGKFIALKHNETYKFAPANHKFKAPSNIKPVKVEPVLPTTKPTNLNISNCRRITRSQKAVLPTELPTRQHKLNAKKDVSKVQITKKLEIETEKPVVKNMVRSAKTKKVALNIESETPRSNTKVYKKTPAKIKRESTKKDKQSSTSNLVQTNNLENIIEVGESVSIEAVEHEIVDDYKTPVKRVNTKKSKSRQSRGDSRKSRRLNKDQNVITSSDDTRTESCDSPKQLRTNEKQKRRNNSVQTNNSGPVVKVVESKRTEEKAVTRQYEIIDDHKMPVKPENVKNNKPRQFGGSSRKSRRLSENQGVTTDDGIQTESCESPMQVRTNEERKKRRNKSVQIQTNNLEPVVKIERSASTENKAGATGSEIKNDIIKNYKTPVKSRRASMKSRQSRGSSRKPRRSNENIENTFNTESKTCDSPKQIKSSTKKQRKSKGFSSLSPEYPPGDVFNSSQSDDNVNECITPHKKTPVIYISPFVTISRGKSSARKEYFNRKSKGGECDSSPDVRRSTDTKAGAVYFQRILDQETNRIQAFCDEWMNYKNTQNPPEEASDMINVAIGQSQLLISKKFKQFQGLINSCERGDSEIPVTCEDLHGYWDVAYIQVENLNKRFENLENLRRNHWEEILPQTNKMQVKKKLGPKKPKGKVTSSLKDAIKAARMKVKSQKPPAEDEIQTENTSTFDGKFFTITSPHKSPSPSKKLAETELLRKTPGRERKSLRAMVLSSEANKRKSTPGWNIIKASHIAQAATVSESVKITPSRSILKGSQLVKKTSKSVLFKDNAGANIILNETYPPAISNEKPFDVFPVLTNITNNDGAQSRRTPKHRKSSRIKLF